MNVWQHVWEMDHLRRRAESKIAEARNKAGSASSQASMGQVGKPYVSTLHSELAMGESLADMTSFAKRGF